MPKFRGPVTFYGYVTIEGNDMYDADENARRLSTEQLLELALKDGHLEAEVFDDEFPEED